MTPKLQTPNSPPEGGETRQSASPLHPAAGRRLAQTSLQRFFHPLALHLFTRCGAALRDPTLPQRHPPLTPPQVATSTGSQSRHCQLSAPLKRRGWCGPNLIRRAGFMAQSGLASTQCGKPPLSKSSQEAVFARGQDFSDRPKVPKSGSPLNLGRSALAPLCAQDLARTTPAKRRFGPPCMMDTTPARLGGPPRKNKQDPKSPLGYPRKDL